MIDRKEERNFISLVKILAESQDQIDYIQGLGPAEVAKFDIQLKALRQDLQHCLEDIYADPQDMAQFSHALRVFDVTHAMEK